MHGDSYPCESCLRRWGFVLVSAALLETRRSRGRRSNFSDSRTSSAIVGGFTFTESAYGVQKRGECDIVSHEGQVTILPPLLFPSRTRRSDFFIIRRYARNPFVNDHAPHWRKSATLFKPTHRSRENGFLREITISMNYLGGLPSRDISLFCEPYLRLAAKIIFQNTPKLLDLT